MALRALKGSRVALAAGLALAAGVFVADALAVPGAAVVTATPVATAASAPGGEYHVYSCRTPAGLVAPTDGWSSPEHSPVDPTSNTCEAGGGLIAAVDAGSEHVPDSETDKATWVFKAPIGEVITEATLWRAGERPGGGNEEASYFFWLWGSAPLGGSAQIFDECTTKAKSNCVGQGSLTEPYASENRVVVPAYALDSPNLGFSTYCGALIASCPNEGNKTTYDAIIELFAADLVLSQSTSPTVSAVGGGLAEDSTVQGTTDVAFHAADSGSGVYEAHIVVDGRVVSHTVLNENGGRCRDVGGTTDGLPAFLYTQPCPAAVSADVPLGTTGLTNGLHHFVVSVTDAAGNAATVLDRELTVANPGSPPAGSARGPANGEDPSEHALLTARWKGASATRLSGRYGVARAIEGRLTGPEGRGIAGALVEVGELPAYAGARTRALVAPRTAADGDWSLALPRDLSSCQLRIAYRSHLGDPLPVATRTLGLTVPAALRLRIAPRTAPSAGAIRFSGRLLGGPVPSGGKQLVLEARSPGGPWIEFHVIRTGAHARFGYLYSFRLPGPAHYQFRVLCESEADFPFAAGASNVVGVLER
jgi:hypothetical protein